MKKTLLVTGGLGYIGSHTVVELLNQGYNIVVIDNLSNSKRDVKEKIKTITQSDFVVYYEDIRNKSALEKIFQTHIIDGIIHFSAFKAVGESCEKPFEYYDNNIIGGNTLYETALKYDVKKIVFSSSCTVYDTTKAQAPYDEFCPRSTINPYGSTKLISEIILKDLATHKGLQVTALRYFNPVGAHESGLIGEDPEGLPNNLLPYMYRVATGQYNKLSVRGNDYPTPDGTCIRDYLHVVDLAKAHLKAFEYLDKKIGDEGIFEAINLGTGTGTSVLEMIKILEQVTGNSLPYTIGPRRSGDAVSVYANPQKAEQLLGRTSQKNVKEAIADGRHFIQQNS